jgi:protein-disulfide isomerase
MSAMTQKKAKKHSKRRNQDLFILSSLGISAILITIILTTLYNRAQDEGSALSPEMGALLVREDSPTRGPADAPVTLVEFLDPECEACRAAYADVEGILEDYEGEIRYVVRYFANHNNSALAAAATEAAGAQGKYWEMQALLFERQPEWGEKSGSQADKFLTYAGSLGLDKEKFAADMQKSEYLTKVERDFRDARALGLTGTPSFFVNGQQVYGMNGEKLRALIETALKG